MAEERYRSLLWKIAMGVPLVAGPLILGSCWCSGNDCGDSEPETITVTAMPDGGTDCYAACPASLPSGKVLMDCGGDDGGVSFTCNYWRFCRGGRRPDGPCEAYVRGPSDARTAWCLELAVAEAASVPAFNALADALRAHGAPASLVERACESAVDEARHTQLALRLAGSGAIRVHIPAAPIPTLEALACSNAAEGCVREAYAALEAAYQSQHAQDPAARAVFTEIARDEARHALLSQDIDRWARRHVSPTVLDEARALAIVELQEALSTQPRPPGLGLPDAATAHALLVLAA